jgi:hypothetical protein
MIRPFRTYVGNLRLCLLNFIFFFTMKKRVLSQILYAVHDYFKHAGGHDIFLLDWRQVLSYDVSLLNIRLVVNSLIESV